MVDMGIGYKAEQWIRANRLVDIRDGDGDSLNSVEDRKQLIDERRKMRKEQKQVKKHAKKDRISICRLCIIIRIHLNLILKKTQIRTNTRWKRQRTKCNIYYYLLNYAINGISTVN